MNDYVLVTGSITQMPELVSAKLDSGYIPIGGLILSGSVFIQPMNKYIQPVTGTVYSRNWRANNTLGEIPTSSVLTTGEQELLS